MTKSSNELPTLNQLRALRVVNAKPINANDYKRKMTGGQVSYIDYDYIKSISPLLNKGWIEVGTPFDSLDYLKIPELKEVLKRNSEKTTGTKAELIQRIKERLADHQISAVNDKKMLVLTDEGKAVLKKYKAFYWADRNPHLMPNYRENGINIDSTYFIKNPDVNPADFLISYFGKEPYKLSILYYNQGNYRQSYYEKLKDITYNLWASLEKSRVGDEMTCIGVHGWYISTGDGQSIPVHTIYNQLSIPTEELELFLHTLYHEFDKEMISNRPEMIKPLSKPAYISFEQYKQIMRLMSEGDISAMDELFKELSAEIREENGYSRDETYQQHQIPYEPPGLDELLEEILSMLPGGFVYGDNKDDFDTTKVEVICKVVESFEKEEIQKVIDYLQGLI